MTPDDDPSVATPDVDAGTPTAGASRTPGTIPGAPEGYPDAPHVELNALLGRGTRYAGKLYFEGRIRIEGRFEGEIRGEDVLVIGQGAEVDGTIEVGVCIVTGGRVRADIRARNAIELHAPATVIGDLHAPNIFIDRGVQFEGNCKMAPLGDPQPADEQAAEDEARLAGEPRTPGAGSEPVSGDGADPVHADAPDTAAVEPLDRGKP